jgi:FSR family fosmidomycin resistance protein-like MFS transporter
MNKVRLFSSAYGHFSIDIVNSSVAMILTLAASQFGLTIAQIGFGAMLYQIMAAMSQPLFGGITDKLRGRWVGPLGVLWTAVFFTGAAFMPNYTGFITCLMLGGLGSGAFHAAGMVHAAMSGGNKPTTSTSVFFLGGQTGLSLGPILAGLIVAPLGLQVGMPLMAAIALPAVVLMLFYMNDELPIASHRPAAASATRQQRQHGAAAILVTAFVLFIMLRSGTSQGFATLLPSYFESLGFTPAEFGLKLGIFSFAGALGTLLGGYLGDRYNRRTIMSLSSLAAAPFAFLMLYTTGWAYTAVAILAGVLLSMPHSILLVMTQELAPNRRGLVGGLVLGFIFASGSTLAWLQSIVATNQGLQPVLTVVAFFPIVAGLIAFLLPSGRRAAPAAPTGTAAPAPAARVSGAD